MIMLNMEYNFLQTLYALVGCQKTVFCLESCGYRRLEDFINFNEESIKNIETSIKRFSKGLPRQQREIYLDSEFVDNPDVFIIKPQIRQRLLAIPSQIYIINHPIFETVQNCNPNNQCKYNVTNVSVQSNATVPEKVEPKVEEKPPKAEKKKQPKRPKPEGERKMRLESEAMHREVMRHAHAKFFKCDLEMMKDFRIYRDEEDNKLGYYECLICKGLTGKSIIKYRYAVYGSLIFMNIQVHLEKHFSRVQPNKRVRLTRRERANSSSHSEIVEMVAAKPVFSSNNTNNKSNSGDKNKSNQNNNNNSNNNNSNNNNTSETISSNTPITSTNSLLDLEPPDLIVEPNSNPILEMMAHKPDANFMEVSNPKKLVSSSNNCTSQNTNSSNNNSSFVTSPIMGMVAPTKSMLSGTNINNFVTNNHNIMGMVNPTPILSSTTNHSSNTFVTNSPIMGMVAPKPVLTTSIHNNSSSNNFVANSPIIGMVAPKPVISSNNTNNSMLTNRPLGEHKPILTSSNINSFVTNSSIMGMVTQKPILNISSNGNFAVNNPIMGMMTHKPGILSNPGTGYNGSHASTNKSNTSGNNCNSKVATDNQTQTL